MAPKLTRDMGTYSRSRLPRPKPPSPPRNQREHQIVAIHVKVAKVTTKDVVVVTSNVVVTDVAAMVKVSGTTPSGICKYSRKYSIPSSFK